VSWQDLSPSRLPPGENLPHLEILDFLVFTLFQHLVIALCDIVSPLSESVNDE
jgi:hypothetical protein